jgi:lysophospholipase L1-like esterase
MHHLRGVLPMAIAVTLFGCGGAGVTGPSSPSVKTQPVSVFVFYDENGNGVRDGQERVHVPSAQVSIGSASGTTDGGGRATLSAPEGQQTLSVADASLPPYFTVKPMSLTVPASAEVMVPATLALGPRLIPNKYMVFGDSNSEGTYEAELESRLGAYFGDALVVDEALGGTRTGGGSVFSGVARIADSLAYARPASTLILYGTNDWNELSCKDDRFPCYTIDSLRSMIHEVRFVGGVAFLGTIPPVNVGFNEQAPPERQEWVARMDDLIRKLARDENVAIVDVQKAILAQPSLKALFDDYVHLNRAGQSIVAQEFFKAITKRQAQTATIGIFPFSIELTGR